MSWPTCMVACVGIAAFCGMICFISWCGFKCLSSLDKQSVTEDNSDDEKQDEQQNA